MTLNLELDAFGRLLLDGEAVTPVRAHPISAPEEGVSLTGADGHERAWIALMADLPDAQQGLLEAFRQELKAGGQAQVLDQRVQVGLKVWPVPAWAQVKAV